MSAFGFRNDLSRVTAAAPAVASDGSTTSLTSLSAEESVVADRVSRYLPENCRFCLSNIYFYMSGYDASEASVKAIAKRFVIMNEQLSMSLLQQVCC